MPLANLYPAMPGWGISAALTVVIPGLMLFMAYRLHAGSRRKAYFNLVISIAFILTYHLLKLALTLGWLPDAAELAFAGKVLQVFSFIVMHFAIFELYYKRRRRTRMWFFALLAIGVAMALCDLLPVGETGAEPALHWERTAWLDGYLLALVPLFALMFAPHIGQRVKYGAGLACAFAAQGCVMLAQRNGQGGASYALAADLLHVAYYILLFMLLFDRVVELLNAVYRSSVTDGLTHLYNRRYFMARLENALKSGKPVGAIFCDIDNFKKLNDTQGHHRADGVLKQVAEIITQETQGIGLAGRYGGEELVAFVVGPKPLLKKTAEAIRQRTEEESIVTVSVGICHASLGAAVAAEKLMKMADEAMYYSKTNGKNRVTDYSLMRLEKDVQDPGMKR